MITIPEFGLALWTIEEQYRRTENSPTHSGKWTDPTGKKWPVIAWVNDDPGKTADGKSRPNVSVKIDENKLKASIPVQREDRQGENIVDNPGSAPRSDEVSKLDELEQRLEQKLKMLERFEELERLQAEEEAQASEDQKKAS